MFRFTDLVIFRFTRDCNINCEYCFMIEKDLYKGEIINFSLFKKIVERIIQQRKLNRQGNGFSFIFHGGEALLVGKERFYKMADYITTRFREENLQLDLGMQTNATLLDDEYAKIIQKFDISLGLSFDGVDEANESRTKEIKQEIFENKFETLIKNKVSFGFLIIVGKHNADKVSESKNYLKKYGVKSYKINYAEDIINPNSEDNVEIDGAEFFNKALKPEIDSFIEGGNFTEGNTQRTFERALTDIFTYHRDKTQTGCGGKFCGGVLHMIGVNPDGESHYCDRYSKEFEETYVEHALDYDFLGIHQLKKAMDFNYDRHSVVNNMNCDTCYANYICEYGCTAMYYSKYGKNGIEEKLVCNLYKRFYDYVIERLDDIVYAYMRNNQGQIKMHEPAYSIRDNIKMHFSNKRISIKFSEDKSSILAENFK